MKTLLLAAAMAVTGAMASATTVTIDFEQFNELDNIDGQTVNDVVFSARGNAVSVETGPDGSLGILGRPVSTDFPYRADFSVPGVTNVSVDLGDLGADEDRIFLLAFDSLGDLISSAMATIPQGVGGYETLSLSGANISYVLFGGVGFEGNNSVYADNFSYTVAAVPLPAGGLLLLGALGAIAVARRRHAAS